MVLGWASYTPTGGGDANSVHNLRGGDESVVAVSSRLSEMRDASYVVTSNYPDLSHPKDLRLRKKQTSHRSHMETYPTNPNCD